MKYLMILMLVLLGVGPAPATAVAQPSAYEEIASFSVDEFVEFYEVVLTTIFVRIGLEEGLTKGAVVLSPDLVRERGGRGDWPSSRSIAEAFQRIADRWEFPMEPRNDLRTVAGITHPIPQRMDGVYLVHYVLAPPGRLRPVRGFSNAMYLERGPDGSWRQRARP